MIDFFDDLYDDFFDEFFFSEVVSNVVWTIDFGGNNRLRGGLYATVATGGLYATTTTGGLEIALPASEQVGIGTAAIGSTFVVG